jgi:hypothetical protein
MGESIDGDISWNSKLEHYFASTGEKAHCLSWIHKKAEERYARLRTFIDLPVIAISSITGFLSVGSTSMFGDNQVASSVALGLCSLLVSVLNTTGTYFGWAKRAEGHRISSIQYARLYRFLSIEMSLPREERMTPADLLKHTKDQYDRLQEISPLVPPEIITEFRKRFDAEKDISKPEEANGLEKIDVYPHPQTPSIRMRSLPSETMLDAPAESPPSLSLRRPEHPKASETGSTLPSRLNPLFAGGATAPAQVGLSIAPPTE